MKGRIAYARISKYYLPNSIGKGGGAVWFFNNIYQIGKEGYDKKGKI
ncbi:MAG: hypothetical protein J0I32_05145 [Sphingobacteriales bacterium]|nr:hypothetical protein [Sphingobacteriales bacterium]